MRPRARRRASLNPLHCGAVVASRRRPRDDMPTRRSQSPSLRGSGRFEFAQLTGVVADVVSQSPSLRGSGRFPSWSYFFGAAKLSLNPLHCGAVVASGTKSRLDDSFFMSQSPSLRGSGRFARTFRMSASTSPSLNPLHCGAVVASGSPGNQTIPRLGLNPLHCGAVVASAPRCMARGQGGTKSQSPSLRGSGRFPHAAPVPPQPRGVSIPFIAGQWSLQGSVLLGLEVVLRESQSPSLRGSGRFLDG